jgi:hypothetical protein
MARFIKAVAPLLDGHEALSTMAVIVGCDAIERDKAALDALVARLAEAQVPFSISVEGNDLLERSVTGDDLDGCSAILIASPSLLAEAARRRVHELAGDRPCVEHFGGKLPTQLPRPIALGGQGAERVWVLPRAVPDDANAPVAVHLLNRDYDAAARAMRPAGPLEVLLDGELFPGRTFTQARLHQPRPLATLPTDDEVHQSEPLTLQRDNGRLKLSVPELELWGIVELT